MRAKSTGCGARGRVGRPAQEDAGGDHADGELRVAPGGAEREDGLIGALVLSVVQQMCDAWRGIYQ